MFTRPGRYDFSSPGFNPAALVLWSFKIDLEHGMLPRKSSFPWQLLSHKERNGPFWLSDTIMWFVLKKEFWYRQRISLQLLHYLKPSCVVGTMMCIMLTSGHSQIGPKTPVCSAQFVRVFISRFQVDFQPGIAGCDERSRLSPKTKMPRTSKMQNAGWRNTTGSITLWLFNIAMENGPFIDGLPIRNGDFPWLC